VSLGESFIVRQSAFQGTLAELAQALRGRVLPPEAIDLTSLVADILAHYRSRIGQDLDDATAALPAAARVIELKLRLLLPHSPEDEAEEDNTVVEALQAVELLAELESAVSFLRERRLARTTVLPAATPPPSYPRPQRPLPVGIERLAQLASRYRRASYFELALERLDLATAMRRLLSASRKWGGGRFRELVGGADWRTLGVMFLALLELVKEGRLRARQLEPYAEIDVEPLAEITAREVA